MKKMLVVFIVLSLVLMTGCVRGSFSIPVTDSETGVVTVYPVEYSSFLKEFDGFDAQLGNARINVAGSRSDTLAISSLLMTVDTLLKKQMQVAP